MAPELLADIPRDERAQPVNATISNDVRKGVTTGKLRRTNLGVCC